MRKNEEVEEDQILVQYKKFLELQDEVLSKNNPLLILDGE